MSWRDEPNVDRAIDKSSEKIKARAMELLDEYSDAELAVKLAMLEEALRNERT